MNVLVVEPGKHPKEVEIKGDLKSMQEIVGGCIEAIYPYDDPVAIVCDDEGLLKGKALNREIDEYNIIAGTFFVCGLGRESFASLSPELMEKYKKILYFPQLFMSENGEIVATNTSEGAYRFFMSGFGNPRENKKNEPER